METKAKSFLGRGWGFPIAPAVNKVVEYASDEKKIQQSILIILGTAKGERMMRPGFGSQLHELTFAAVDSSTKSLISHYATEALIEWEPRIEVLGIDISEEEADRGKLLVNIEYKIKATNSTFNLVYPFYLAEAGEKKL